MDTKALKSRILQLAIQGKLVPQDPKNEAASVLLEKIKEEKEKLIKEKKIKKQKPLPPITQEEIPFEIPDSWEWGRLGDIAQFINGDRGKNYPSKNELVDEGIPFINAGHLDKAEIDFSNMNYITKEKYQSLKNGKIHIKDIIYCLRGTLGKCSINTKLEKGAIASSLVIIRKYKNIDEKYLYYYLISPLGNYMIRKFDNGTAQPNLSAKSVRLYSLPLPPLTEQKRIVEKVDALFPLIDTLNFNKDQLQETINITRNKVLKEAVKGKLVPQNLEDEAASVLLEKIKEEKEKLIKEKKKKKQKPLPPITEEEIPYILPEGWTVIRFGDLAEYKKGPFGSSITKSMFVPKSDTTVKVYEQKNAIRKNVSMGDYYITKEKFGELQSFEVYPGDIIVSCAGTIGETFIMPKDMEKGIINQALMKITLSKYIEKEFYLMYFKYVLTSQITNKSKGSAIKNIPPLKHLKSIVFPLPPLAEQKRIVKKANKIMALCDELEKKINITL